MSKHLVLMDTDKIKRYIHSSSKLKSIRGASSILSELNDKKAVKIRVEKHSGECIFAGGGQVMAKFDSGEEAGNFIRTEQAEYEQYDASITGIKEEYTKSFKDVMENARIRLTKAKEEKAYKKQLLSNPFFKTCQLCGINPASEQKYELCICTSCEMKIERGEEIRRNPKKSPIFKIFLNFIKDRPVYQEWNKAVFTDDLSDLGKLSKPKNYLGLIYADGNRMGERLFMRTSETEYQELSKAIEKGLQESVFESLLEYIPNPYDRKIPFEFVIMGGDDLIMLTPAEKAIPIALKILEKFEEKTADFANSIKQNKFTLSAGVAIAHSKYPVSSFAKRGEDLLESAKKVNKKSWYGVKDESKREDISTIDYSVITTPSANPVDIMRENDLTYTIKTAGQLNYYTLTQRPFTLQKACKVLEIVEQIKQSGLSRSRLYSISNTLIEGKNQPVLNILSLITRLKENEKGIKKLFEKIRNETLFYQDNSLFPWNILKENTDTYDTPFLDFLEIYDFIEEGRQ